MNSFLTFVLIVLAIAIVFVVTHYVTEYLHYNHLEVGDQLCVKYDMTHDSDVVFPQESTTVVSVKHDINDKVESVTFENGVTMTSFKDYLKSGWFLIMD